MGLDYRLKRLERVQPAYQGGDCPSPFNTCIVLNDDPVPENPVRCKICNEPHVLRLFTRVVTRSTLTREPGRLFTHVVKPETPGKEPCS
jgi:hypothetical protein